MKLLPAFHNRVVPGFRNGVPGFLKWVPCFPNWLPCFLKWPPPRFSRQKTRGPLDRKQVTHSGKPGAPFGKRYSIWETEYSSVNQVTHYGNRLSLSSVKWKSYLNRSDTKNNTYVKYLDLDRLIIWWAREAVKLVLGGLKAVSLSMLSKKKKIMGA